VISEKKSRRFSIKRKAGLYGEDIGLIGTTVGRLGVYIISLMHFQNFPQ